MKSARRITAMSVIVLLLAAALMLASCGGGQPAAPTQAPAQAGTVAPVPTKPQPADTPTPEPPTPTPKPPTPTPEPPTPTPEPTQEAATFSDWWQALETDLQTLHARTTMQDSTGLSVIIELKTVKEPPATHVFLDMKGEEGPGALEMIQIGDTIYMRSQEDGQWQDWMSIASSDPASQISPDELFAQPFAGLNTWESRDLEVVNAHETVNGVDTIHYRVSDTAIARLIQLAPFAAETPEPGELQITGAQADFWVARDGNYLVKAAIHIEGTQDNQPYTGDITTEVLSVNQPLTIEPPAGVAKPGLPEDVPAYPGATMSASAMGMTTFEVSATLEEVANFYKEQMPASGWTLGESTEMEGLLMLSFSKGDRTCQVMATAEGEKINLMITCPTE